MKKYLIAYDLKGKGKNYDGIVNSIKLAYKWSKVLETTWVVWADGPAETISANLSKYLDSDDSIIVLRLSDERDAGWKNITPASSEFLRSNW